ncbi:AMP-binding protein [Chelativorans sp. Marseille-P2723]|uniref:AMP-binding protein n=1 Tax=Chelativorans sp. Marseille-P2723 TaxID=2709133 RepID=UPI0015711913|nr:AMP-binding protein [Chelativorans sp. Marseille-P2723]
MIKDCELPLPQLLARRVQTDPDKAFVSFEGQGLTYRDAERASRSVAAFLRGAGVSKHDRVGIMLDNGPNFIATWFGINRNGAIEVPLNTALRGDHLQYIIQNCGMCVLVMEQKYLPLLAGIELPEALRMLVVVEESGGAELVSSYRDIQVVPFRNVVTTDGKGYEDAELTIADPAAIIYTSGTTGPSKGVVCPYGHLLGLAIDTIELLAMGPDDILYDAHPLYHAHSQGQAVAAAMVANIPVHMRRSFSASGFIKDVVQYGITTAFLIGAAGLVLKQPPSPNDRSHNLRVICAVPIPKGLKRPLEERFGVPVVDLYGMSEMGVISSNPIQASVEGSCGVPSPRREVMIADELDRPVPAGAPGEILVRPKVPWATFIHYWGMPEATSEAFRNLWFHTGDRAFLDENGYIHFIGRIKDSVRRRGENVSCFEVEQVINTHDHVLESAVLPYPSPVGEDDLWVVVVPRQGAPIDAAELIAFCEQRLPRYAVPRYVQFIDEFPKTPTERIEKYKLVKAGLSPDAYDRETVAERQRA